MNELINGEAVFKLCKTPDAINETLDLSSPMNEAKAIELAKLQSLDRLAGSRLYAEPVAAVRYAIKWGKIAPHCGTRLPIALIRNVVQFAEFGEPTCRLVLQWLIAKHSINGMDLHLARQDRHSIDVSPVVEASS